CDGPFGGGPAFGNNVWVLAAKTINPGRIEVSSDLVQWTTASSGPSERLFHVNSSSGVSVAVGEGTILASSNGLTWAREVSSSGNPIYAITHVTDLWVTVGEMGAILTSSNVTAWVPQAS